MKLIIIATALMIGSCTKQTDIAPAPDYVVTVIPDIPYTPATAVMVDFIGSNAGVVTSDIPPTAVTDFKKLYRVCAGGHCYNFQFCYIATMSCYGNTYVLRSINDTTSFTFKLHWIE